MRRRTRQKRAFLAGASLLFLGILSFVYLASFNNGDGPAGSVAAGYQLSKRLPHYAKQDDFTLASYAVAVEIPRAVEMIPCYCSCDSVGHESLKDCFLRGRGFTSHGANCGICKVEAVKTAELLIEQGMSIKEARSLIDAQFGGGKYGRGTPTSRIAEDGRIGDLAPQLKVEEFRRLLASLTG